MNSASEPAKRIVHLFHPAGVRLRRAVADLQPEQPKEPAAEPCRCGLDLLPLSVAAARLGVNAFTMRKLQRRGFPTFRLSPGGRSYCLWSQVEQWARRRAKGQR